MPPRGQFSEPSAAAAALASIVGDGGESAPRSAPAKQSAPALVNGAPLRAVALGVGGRLFDDQFTARLLSQPTALRSPISPVPLPPPGIPQPRRPTEATLDREIAALAGAVDRQYSGSVPSTMSRR